MKNSCRKYRENQEGGLVVEAALLMPILITLGLGGLDASNMMLQNHKLESQLTIASAYLSKSGDPTGKETFAKHLAVNGNIAGTGDPLIPGWKTDDVSVTYVIRDNSNETYRGGETVQTIQVSSTVSYKGFGILDSILPKGVHLNATVEQRLVGGGL